MLVCGRPNSAADNVGSTLSGDRAKDEADEDDDEDDEDRAKDDTVDDRDSFTLEAGDGGGCCNGKAQLSAEDAAVGCCSTLLSFASSWLPTFTASDS